MTGTESSASRNIVEAALFMSPEPLKLERLSQISGIHSLGILKQMLTDLMKDYSERGFNLVESPEGWLFQVRSDILPKVANLTPYSDLPEGAKRTLALIAFREPLMQSELIKIQGNKAYAYIKNLHSKGLVKTEKEGRTKVLSLTQEFERYFGEKKEEIKEKLIRKINEKELRASSTEAGENQ